MIDFKLVELQDRSTIDLFLRSDSFMISDISFGNLFMWRGARRIRFAILHDCVVIETTYAGGNPFVFFPVGGGDKKRCLLDLKQYYHSQGLPLELHSLESSSVVVLREVFGDVHAVLNRDRSDYVYLTDDLIHLSGRKYHRKKNLLNRFFCDFVGFTFESISGDNTMELKSVCEEWFNEDSRAQENVGLVSEHAGIMDVLDNYDSLCLMGGLLRYMGDIMAFSFGEIVSGSMCVIHIEKANIRFKGAYQAINQQLLKHHFSGVRYVNREEDLGIDGLRKSKMSYHPSMIIEKYEATV